MPWPAATAHIIWTPHKPGMITRWPLHVAPPAARGRADDMALLRATDAAVWQLVRRAHPFGCLIRTVEKALARGTRGELLG
jgi:hypothetical protein